MRPGTHERSPAARGSPFRPAARRKRSDLIADEIKRWAVAERLVAGDRLPNEQQLAKIFVCGKGTVREALKSLEVQGLVAMQTGPNGGPVMCEAGYARTAEQLRAYLNFKKLTIDDIYAARVVIETAMAVATVGHIDADGFALLQSRAHSCPKDASRRSGLRTVVRTSELDFHTILAEYCPNAILAFQSRFLTDLLRDYIRFEGGSQADFARFTDDNCSYHQDLLDAYRAGDTERVGRLMRAHMESARKHTLQLFGTIAPTLLMQSEDAGL